MFDAVARMKDQQLEPTDTSEFSLALRNTGEQGTAIDVVAVLTLHGPTKRTDDPREDGPKIDVPGEVRLKGEWDAVSDDYLKEALSLFAALDATGELSQEDWKSFEREIAVCEHKTVNFGDIKAGEWSKVMKVEIEAEEAEPGDYVIVMGLSWKVQYEDHQRQRCHFRIHKD